MAENKTEQFRRAKLAASDAERDAWAMRKQALATESRARDAAERRTSAPHRLAHKKRHGIFEWPLDAETLQPSERVSALDVRAPLPPPPPDIQNYQLNANAAPDMPIGMRPELLKPGQAMVDPTLEVHRHAEHMRELAEQDALRGPKWTSEIVDARLTEAFLVLWRTPMRIWPREFGNVMPKTITQMADLVAQEENRAQRKLMSRLLRRYGPVTTAQTRRMEEAICWSVDFLKGCEPSVPTFVNLGGMWHAQGAVIKRKCREFGVWPQTFYRVRATGLQIIAQQLAARGRSPT